MAVSPNPNSGTGYSLVQTMTPDQLTASIAEKRRPKKDDTVDEELEMGLNGYIRKQWDMMRTHRSSAAGWNHRLLAAQRAFNREYDPAKLAQIREFQGSEVYAGVVATKCRGATALLREVYLEPDRPWGLDPTPEPTLPNNIEQAIRTLVEAEMRALMESGQQVPVEKIEDRIQGLITAALKAAKKQAKVQAQRAEDKIDDFLVEGGFYQALGEFLVDLPIFPFACIKGPVVRVVQQVKWEAGEGGQKAVLSSVAKMFWERKSPFDIYFTPGASDIRDADVIEINRLTRADLNALIGVPGYSEEKIRAALTDYGSRGLKEWLDPTDSERAKGENRESPQTNNSGIIDCLEFHGNVQGKHLLEWGLSENEVPDADIDYFVQVWMVGRHVIKAQIHPSPRKRAPYFITSFEKVPGTPVGNSIPDIIGDQADVCNATLRALVNNMSIASGPQVIVNRSRMAPGADEESLFPWKRWYVQDDPFHQNSSAQKPIDFFQPQSIAQDLLVVYEKHNQMADELSAIPRYTTGSDRMGGAGRTASGLAMLMGNANKILKTVCSNVDGDVIEPAIQTLYDFLMLMDKTSMFRGDESIRVRGVQVALQKETNRQRQMEALQATNNPTDFAIMGPIGRGALLRGALTDIGLPGQDIVPPEDELKAKLEEQARMAAEQAAEQQASDLQQNGERSQVTTGGNSGSAPKGANTDLGVQEAQQMRNMVRAS